MKKAIIFASSLLSAAPLAADDIVLAKLTHDAARTVFGAMLPLYGREAGFGEFTVVDLLVCEGGGQDRVNLIGVVAADVQQSVVADTLILEPDDCARAPDVISARVSSLGYDWRSAVYGGSITGFSQSEFSVGLTRATQSVDFPDAITFPTWSVSEFNVDVGGVEAEFEVRAIPELDSLKIGITTQGSISAFDLSTSNLPQLPEPTSAYPEDISLELSLQEARSLLLALFQDSPIASWDEMPVVEEVALFFGDMRWSGTALEVELIARTENIGEFLVSAAFGKDIELVATDFSVQLGNFECDLSPEECSDAEDTRLFFRDLAQAYLNDNYLGVEVYNYVDPQDISFEVFGVSRSLSIILNSATVGERHLVITGLLSGEVE